MNTMERIKVVRAMETLARCINDGEVFMTWLYFGVADMDITETTSDMELMDYVTDDDHFAELMGIFLKCMSMAKRSGGLYVDGVTSC